ncbi:MAG: hypothetical protein CMJ48_04935 [Planctomycetaceae bacterium]|nr:hypothetical protein [Planctomycetaceae bacterium]
MRSPRLPSLPLPYSLVIVSLGAMLSLAPPNSALAQSGFRRADAGANGVVDLEDVLTTLRYLYLGDTAPACLDAADADDSGALDLTDAIYTINFLLRAGPPPTAPGPSACGADPTADLLAWTFGGGDLDGDGDIDLVTGGYPPQPGPGEIAVLENRGDGTFVPEGHAHPMFGPVAVGDLDGDGREEIVLTEHEVLRALSWSREKFTETVFLPLSGKIALIDFDRDGDLDLIDGGGGRLFWNLGEGRFRGPYTMGGRLFAVHGGDLNADGIVDLVGINTEETGFSVLPGAFGEPESFLTGVCPRSSLALGDFDADGDLDVATVDACSDRAIVHLNRLP